MIDIAKNIATAPRRTKASVIRELLKITNKPGIISFAGGLPDPELFPYDFVADAVKNIIENENADIFVPIGGEAETFIPLRKELSDKEFENKIQDIFGLSTCK